MQPVVECGRIHSVIPLDGIRIARKGDEIHASVVPESGAALGIRPRLGGGDTPCGPEESVGAAAASGRMGFRVVGKGMRPVWITLIIFRGFQITLR